MIEKKLGFLPRVPSLSLSLFSSFCLTKKKIHNTTMSNKSTIAKSNSRQWRKSFFSEKTELIKLSTVNGSGIYLPPSPSDEFNRNEHYFTTTTTTTTNTSSFTTQQNFYIPCSDKLTYTRNLYTPSSTMTTK